MEMRQVRRRTRRRRKGTFSPALFLIGGVFAAVVYGIGASKLGTWLASSVVAPAIYRLAPVETPAPVLFTSAPAKEAEVETLAISLPAVRCYAVQIGVYGELANAEAQSESLRKLGAAGYISADGERYRVLAAGYPDESSMVKVRAQLEGSGIDSLTHEIVTDGMRLKVSGTPEQLEALEAALSFTAALPERLSEEVIRFDRDALGVAEGVEAMSGIRSLCVKHMSAFDELDEKAGETLEPVKDYLDGVAALIDGLERLDAGDTVPFSSAVKRLYLDAVFGYRQMTKRIDA